MSFAGQQQILQKVIAILIYLGTDPMRRKRPALRGQLRANIATDLAHPNILFVERERGAPNWRRIEQVGPICPDCPTGRWSTIHASQASTGGYMHVEHELAGGWWAIYGVKTDHDGQPPIADLKIEQR